MNKQTRTGWRLVATLAALAVLAGCETTKLDETTAAPVESRGGTAGGAAGTGGAGATAAGTPQSGVATVTLPGQGAAGGANAAMAAPSQRIVYFDFDSFVIKDEFKGMLDGHARALMASRGKRMAIEGHADERGSREYNLALGQKRAEAVARSLQLLGVGEQQLEAVSFGEERPAVQGSDEAAWAANRRAELKDR